MNYYNYNTFCLITSIIVLILVIFKVNYINLCFILILSAVFSILWRSTKLIKGEKEINENGYRRDPLFILDLSVALLAFFCIFYSNQVNRKFYIITIFVFILAWLFFFMKHVKTARVLHSCGHCYVVIIFILTFYLYIT